MPARRQFLVTLVKLIDLSVVLAALLGAWAMASGESPWQAPIPILDAKVSVRLALALAAYLSIWHLALRSCGLYGSYRLSAPLREMRDLSVASLASLASARLLSWLLHGPGTPASFWALLALLTVPALAATRTLLRILSRWARRSGRNLRDVLVVGDPAGSGEIVQSLSGEMDLGYRIAEVIRVDAGSIAEGAAAVVAERLEDAIARQPLDEVFVALPLDRSSALVSRLVSVCEDHGIIVRLLANLSGLRWSLAGVDTLAGQPVVTVSSAPANPDLLAVKRAIDLVGASFGLLLLAPLFAVIAVVVKLDTRGPVFFAQERMGLNRRSFRVFKFRTMVVEAEALQPTLERQNEALGPVFKIRDDPRITRVGRWLRETSIDELPQLVNVIRGEMSLVGPRPLPRRDVDRIDVRWHNRRFSVKPGITCLWQVESREPRFEEWIRRDMDYIDNWSLALDLKILWRTVPAVLSRQGAH